MKFVKHLEKLKLSQKISVLLITTIFIAIGNFYFFNSQSFQIPKEERIYSIDLNAIETNNLINENGILISESSNAKLKLNFRNNYVRYLIIYCNSNSNFNMSLTGKYKNEFGVVRDVDSITKTSSTQKNVLISEKNVEQEGISVMKLGAFNLNDEVQELSLNIDKENVEITNIVVDNSVYFNWDTFVFYAILINMILIILMFNTLLFKNIHILAFALCISIGSIFIIVGHNIPSVAMDGHSHYINYKILDNQVSLSDYYLENNLIDFVSIDTKIEKKEFNRLMNQNSKNIIEVRNNQWNIFNIGNIVKFPEAIALKLARVLNLPYNTCNVFARVVHLLIYAIIIMYAVKIMPTFKVLTMIMALLPQNLFLATNFNRDTSITAFLLLSFAIFLNEYYHKEKKLNKKNAIIFVISGILGCSSKIIYAPILLLPLLLPKTKFENDKQCKFFKMVIVAIMVIILFGTLLLSMFASSNFNTMLSDTRGGDVSGKEQIITILQHPFHFIQLFINETIFGTIGMLFSSQAISSLSYYGYEKNANYIILIFTILLAFLSEKKQLNISEKHRLMMGSIYYFIICLIWGSMYISFTPVGNTSINGVQSRYFLPILLPIICCFSTQKIKNTFNTKSIFTVCSIFILVINCFIIYKLIISVYCL